MQANGRWNLIRRLKGLNTNINIYGNIILSVFLYVFETWSLTLREKLRPRVFENRVLRKIFGTKRDKVAR